MAQLDKTTSEKVLNIGVSFRNSRGGVPEVERYHAQLFAPYKFIGTSVDGNKFKKLIFASTGLVRFVSRLAFDRKIEIVHVHGCSDNSFWRKRLFVNIAKRFGKKVVYHMHSGGFLDFARNHRKAVQEHLDKCDTIVALTQNWKQFFKDEFGKGNVVVIHNGIYLPESTERIEHPTFNLLFLGKINKNKGIYDLLQVLADNKERYQGRVKLYFGGEGETDKTRQYIENHGLQSMAEHIGWVTGEKKAQYLRMTDALVLPSYFEGLPVCILEAMSYGLPVIATRVGGVPDAIDDGVNGFLFEPGDLAAMTAAIDKLLGNPALAKSMGEKSLKRIDDYTPEYVARRLSEVYSKLK